MLRCQIYSIYIGETGAIVFKVSPVNYMSKMFLQYLFG